MVRLITFLAIVLGGYLIYSGVFFTTGKQWYDACWERGNAHSASKKPSKKPKATTATQELIWEKCDHLSEKAVYASGIMWTARLFDEVDPASSQTDLTLACPSVWRDLPAGGTYLLSLELIKDIGGPNPLDRFLPAEKMISRAFTVRWPDCDAMRRKHGYPKIVEVSRGEFDWAEPCLPCEDDHPAPLLASQVDPWDQFPLVEQKAAPAQQGPPTGFTTFEIVTPDGQRFEVEATDRDTAVRDVEWFKATQPARTKKGPGVDIPLGPPGR